MFTILQKQFRCFDVTLATVVGDQKEIFTRRPTARSTAPAENRIQRLNTRNELRYYRIADIVPVPRYHNLTYGIFIELNRGLNLFNDLFATSQDTHC